MRLRADVLELMAEEIASRLTDPLASFVTWDGGRRRLDGVAVHLFDHDRKALWYRENRSWSNHLHLLWSKANPEKRRLYARRTYARALKDPVRAAKLAAKAARQREGKARRGAARWRLNLDANRKAARERMWLAYPRLYKPVGIRKCSLCGDAGHNRRNRRRCGVAR